MQLLAFYGCAKSLDGSKYRWPLLCDEVLETKNSAMSGVDFDVLRDTISMEQVLKAKSPGSRGKIPKTACLPLDPWPSTLFSLATGRSKTHDVVDHATGEDG